MSVALYIVRQTFVKSSLRSIVYRSIVLFDMLMLSGFDNPTLVAISSTVHFWNYNSPMQGHLALTGDPTKMA